MTQTPSAGLQSLPPGTVVGGGSDTYEIIAELGRGGMGVVYKAMQISMQRVVALKLLSTPGQINDKAVQRFRSEARICATLSHPNIVRVFSLSQTAGHGLFLVMEYVEGKTLADILAESGPLSKEKFQKYFNEALGALAALHAAGLVHRDIKPANLMVTADDTIKIMDFGIAKDLEGPSGAQQALTQTGAVLGSPWYMSPEQCRGDKLDARTDLYSLGCVMYESLSGKHPFAGENALAVMYKHLHDQLTTANELELPFYSKLILKAMAKSPEDRFASAEQMQQAMAEDQAQQPRLAKPKRTSFNWKWLALAAAVPLLALVLLCTVNTAGPRTDSAPPADLTPDEIGKTLERSVQLVQEANIAKDPKEKTRLHDEALAGFEQVLQSPRGLNRDEQQLALWQAAMVLPDSARARKLWQTAREITPPSRKLLYDGNYADWLYANKKYAEVTEFLDGPVNADLHNPEVTPRKEEIDSFAVRRVEYQLYRTNPQDAATYLKNAIIEHGWFDNDRFRALFDREIKKYDAAGAKQTSASLIAEALPRAQKQFDSDEMALQSDSRKKTAKWLAAQYDWLMTYYREQKKLADFDATFAKARAFMTQNELWDELAWANVGKAQRLGTNNDLDGGIAAAQEARRLFQKGKNPLNARHGAYQIEFWYLLVKHQPEQGLKVLQQAAADTNAPASPAAKYAALAMQGRALNCMGKFREAEKLLYGALEQEMSHGINDPTARMLTYLYLTDSQTHLRQTDELKNTFAEVQKFEAENNVKATRPDLYADVEDRYKLFLNREARH